VQIFFLTLLILVNVIYCSLFAYSLYQEKNKPGMTAVIFIIVAIVISPFFLNKY
jgi:hypothetical protein